MKLPSDAQVSFFLSTTGSPRNVSRLVSSLRWLGYGSCVGAKMRQGTGVRGVYIAWWPGQQRRKRDYAVTVVDKERT